MGTTWGSEKHLYEGFHKYGISKIGLFFKRKPIYKWMIWTYPHILGNLTYGMSLWEHY